MNFQQTIFMNNANAASSKGKTQSTSKQSGNSDFYKIIQNFTSSQSNNGSRQVSSASSSRISGTDADSSQINSDTDDLIDESVINQALGVKIPDTETQKTDAETKFSAKDVKAIMSNREALEEISAEFNIPMEVIDAFIAQIALQTMGGETMPDNISEIVNAIIKPDETADLNLNLSEETVSKVANEYFTDEFIDRLKEFAEMSENDRTAQKYSDLNEFVDSVQNGLDLNLAARRVLRQDHLLNRLTQSSGVADITDETTDFVTEKILSHLNIDADSLSDLEIVSIEKLLNENLAETDNLTSLIQKLRSPWTTAAARFREAGTEVTATAEVSVETQETELIPVNISTAESENTLSGKPERDELPVIEHNDPINNEMIPGNITGSETTEEIKQFPDMITHYTRSANSIENLIMNNKSGENFQVKMLLRPEGLGEMLVRVTYNKGDINVTITTDNALAQKELANQSAALRNSLAEYDFNLMNFDVGNKNPDDRNQRGGEESGKKNKNRTGKISGTANDNDENVKISSSDIIQLRNIYQNRILYKQV